MPVNKMIETFYSSEPRPTSGIMAAVRNCPPVGVLWFRKDECEGWLAELYDNGELVALASMGFFYQNGHLHGTKHWEPVYVDIDPVIVEQAHEYLENDGERPEWWR